MVNIVEAKNDLLQRLRAKYPNFANRISPAALRLSSSFDADVLEFQVKKTEGKYRSDVKLRDNDIFFFNLIALGWTATTANEAGKDPIFYYPDAIAETKWEEVETLYNGTIQLIEGDQNILIPSLSTSVFRRVSETQQTENAGAVQTQPSYENPFFYTAVGTGLSGNKDYTFTLNLGQGTRANITTHRAVLLLDGFVIPSAATSVTVANA